MCLVMFLEGLSSSSINVQVAAVRADLSPGPVGLQLVATTFLIAYAALLLPAGRLADWLDRRKVFLCGLGLFAVGSLAGTLAPTVEVLIGARLAQGAGAALTAPAALALITAPLPAGAERNRLVALYGALGAVGFSTGLVLPGFLVTHYGWRSSFAVLLPCVLLVAALTWRVPSNPTGRGGDSASRPDLWGTVALFGLIGGATWMLGALRDLTAPLALSTLAVLTVLATVVVRRGRTVPDRLLVRDVRRAMAALAGAFAGVLASIYVLTLALQDWHGLTAFTVGLLVLPQPACFALLARYGSAWVNRSGAVLPLLTGLALITAATGSLALLSPTHPSVPHVLVAMAGVGAGLALAYPAASIMAVNAAPESLRGSTAAVLTTAQNVGGSAGLALVTALALVPQPDAPGSLTAPMVVCALMVLAGLVLALRAGRSTNPQSPDPQSSDPGSADQVGVPEHG
ncbi:hypothetical protein GCM10009583_01680 [Ornithinicoccus hortensis]